MYKVYPPQSINPVICDSLTEVRLLVGANAAQTKRIFWNNVATVNGYDVINYSR